MKKLSLLILSLVFSGLIGGILVWQFWPKKVTPPEINLKTTKLAEIPKKYEKYELDRHVFSPNGKNIAYRVNEGNKDFIIVNDKEGKRYVYVDFPIFSPDGKQLAYIAAGPEKWFIVVNNKEGKGYNYVRSFLFSPDSKQYAYIAHEGAKQFVVLNDKEGKRYDWVGDPVFSSDGKYLAYGAIDGNEFWWIVEPVELKQKRKK